MNHVLVIQLARFGDIIQTKRLMASLAAEQDTTVHICVDSTLVSVAQLMYPYAVVHGLTVHFSTSEPAVFLSIALAAQELQEISFSRVYSLNASPLTNALVRLFAPQIVIGYKVQGNQPLKSHWCRIASRLTGSRSTSPLNLIDYWGYFHPSPVDPASVNPVAKKAGTNMIGVVLAGQQARRSLPPPILAECLSALFRSRQGPQFVLLGTDAEVPLARQLVRLLPRQIVNRTIDRTGQTTVSDLFSLLPELDLVVTPDTGIMHLAAHIGVPVQAFFLSSAWCFETGPYGLGHTVWQSIQPCSPCLEVQPCPNNVQCLHDFTHPAFLMHLSGKFSGEWPSSLCGFVSSFDALGATFVKVDGVDPHEQPRATNRHILKEYIFARKPIDLSGVATPQGELMHGSSFDLVHAAEHIFRDRDFVLTEE